MRRAKKEQCIFYRHRLFCLHSQWVSSMYPEKMTFDGFVLRTPRVNEAVRFIYMINSELGENKNRTTGKNSNLSCEAMVIRTTSLLTPSSKSKSLSLIFV